MRKKSTDNYVLEKIRVIRPWIDGLDEELDDVALNLSEKGTLHTVSRSLPKVRIAKTLTENISIEIDKMEHKLSQGSAVRSCPSTRSIPHPLKQVHRLQISFEADGMASAYIDDLVPFRLPPVLASLLQVLAMDTGTARALCADDPLVPYKSYEEIISNMTIMLGGRGYTKGALREGIYRLRRIMAEHDFDGLIQTNRRLGAYRLALRRKSNSPIAA